MGLKEKVLFLKITRLEDLWSPEYSVSFMNTNAVGWSTIELSCLMTWLRTLSSFAGVSRFTDMHKMYTNRGGWGMNVFGI